MVITENKGKRGGRREGAGRPKSENPSKRKEGGNS